MEYMEFGLLIFIFVHSIISSVAGAEYSPVLSWDVCSPSRIVVTLAGGANGGIIYIRGYGSACKQDTTSEETVHEFEFETCGIAKAETYFTIIVQQNPLYQTGGDLQESLLCIYDLSEISVGNGQNIGNKVDDNGVNKTVKPSAAMRLYKDGVDISGSDVKLTDLVTMTIQLDDEYLEDFDVKVKSCTANYLDIIKNTCAVDTVLFPEFAHVTQGVVTSSFGAFRTTDLGGGYVEMVFACTMQVCRGLCVEETCDGVTEQARRRRAVDEDVVFEDLNVGTSMSVGTDIDITPTDKDADDSVCIANVAFIVGLMMILFVLITSLSLTIFATGKLIKRTEQLRKLTSDHEVQKAAQAPKTTIEKRISCKSTNGDVATQKLQNNNCNIEPTGGIITRSTLNSKSTKTVLCNQSAINYPGNQSAVNYAGNQSAINYAGKKCAVNYAGNKCAENYAGNQPAINSACKQSADNQAWNKSATKLDISEKTPVPRKHDTVVEARELISDADLNQLKQFRDMLNDIRLRELLGKTDLSTENCP